MAIILKTCFIFICVCVSVCVNVCMPQECRHPRKLEVKIGSPGARVTGGYELPDMGARNGAPVLWKGNGCS